MTVKDAILKSLEEIGSITNYIAVTEHISKNNYCDFNAAKTPAATVSAQLGNFIRECDSRVKRIKQNGGYGYYLTKNSEKVESEITTTTTTTTTTSPEKIKQYIERDLHILLSSYLNSSSDIYTKTIYQEESRQSDLNQIWTHPDMIGIKFLKLKSKESQNLLKSVNKIELFKISSYELKREINNDNELKKAFFQAVSNSSWSNYGYLVALEFSDNLMEEMERLNKAFGIGIIKLNSNPFQSKILFQSSFRDLDFKTIDKLCNMNDRFKQFVSSIDNIMNAKEQYLSGTMKEFEQFCDKYFTNDSETEQYCIDKNIPKE